MSNDTNFVLVETSPTEPNRCIQIVRSYVGERRASEGRDLLEQILPDRIFKVIPINHIDD